MHQRDSRRLRGPNMLWDRPSAILDVVLSAEESAGCVAAWRAAARRMLVGVGWADEQLCSLEFPGGAMLALSAPIDALLCATEVNEWALASAREALAGGVEPDFETERQRLLGRIATQRNPRLAPLRDAARARGISFFWDDTYATLGHGARSRSWRLGELPLPEEVDWQALGNVPTAFITGTNGKSTTARLLGGIARSAGLVPGLSSTDWVLVGDEILDHGDYSGPTGARLVLRDPRTQIALLETARGGIMRRGLALDEVDVALVTNVAEDHLGEFANADVAALAAAKFTITRVARRVVLNADCGALHAPARGVRAPITWFSKDPEQPLVRAHRAAGGEVLVVRDGWISLESGNQRRALVALAKVPLTLGGAAPHNVENALGAAAVALHLGLSAEQVARGLEQFHSTPTSNPGRMNEFQLGGVRALVDFAHNPHGSIPLYQMAHALQPARWALVLGQAGDRDDASVRELVAVTVRAQPDLIVIKEMHKYLRGRPAGAMVALLEQLLLEMGFPRGRFEHAPSEMAAVRRLLEWSRPGDLLLLFAHAQRAEVIALLQQLAATNWGPGQPLPED